MALLLRKPALACLLAAAACQGDFSLRWTGSTDGLTVEYVVHPCTRSESEQEPRLTDFAFRADGGRLFLKHTLHTYCNAVQEKFLSIDVTVDGQQVGVAERFVGDAVRCECSFPVAVEVEGLEPGRYSVTITYQASVGGEAGEVEPMYEGEIAVKS